MTFKGNKILVRAIYVLSIALILIKYFSLWIEGWTSVLFFAIGIGAFLILTILTIYYLVKLLLKKQYYHRKYLPVLLSAISIIIVLYDPIEKIIEKTKSPVVLAGYCEHTVTQVSLILRENNTFEYNAGAFLKAEIYKGTYIIIADTIILEFDEINPDNIGDTLVYQKNIFQEIGDNSTHNHSFKIITNKVVLKNTSKDDERTRNIDLQITFSEPNTELETAHLLLIVDSLNQKPDTIELTNCLVYDRMPPRSYLVNDRVVYEDCERNPSHIKVMDLNSFDILFDKPGFIDYYSESANPFDDEHNVLIYFSTMENTNDFIINKLDLNSITSSKIDTLENSNDALTGVPTADILDPTERIVSISYETKEGLYEEKELKY